ncbi:MAG: hydrogenase nickel incorporation protein HypB [Thermodesulfobacteriota bacterium]|nr:hydrogenase nickel incorporation protein HypB [Thermodesulfobacteriota bacterium]
MDKVRLIEIKEDILSDNESMAAEVRKRIKREKAYLLNLMSSPGAGKTSLILRTLEKIKHDIRVGVIEADIDSTVDAEKVIAESGTTAIQLRTGGFCHLDASMVTQGLDALNLDSLDLIIIENVGNLVCPAEFDTGATKNAMILSVPEGDDKPLKYPLMFSICNVLLINKIDYLADENFDLEALKKRVTVLNPDIRIIEISCKTGEGIDKWVDWLRDEVGTSLSE